MPDFRIPAGALRRLAAATLLSLAAAGCAPASPDLPELDPAAAKSPSYDSAFAEYQAFAPEARDDWRQARPSGGMMAMTMNSGAMDHSGMDHGGMQQGMPMAPAGNSPAHQH